VAPVKTAHWRLRLVTGGPGWQLWAPGHGAEGSRTGRDDEGVRTGKSYGNELAGKTLTPTLVPATLNTFEAMFPAL